MAVMGLRDFQWHGGINLSADHTELADNEVPWAFNVRVDERNGFRARNGFEEIRTLAEVSWQPRNMYRHLDSDGDEHHFLANDGGVLVSKNEGVWQSLSLSATLTPHGADFVSWDDNVYIQGGGALYRWTDATTVVALTDPAATAGAGWSTPDAPVLAQGVVAKSVCAWNGYLIAANTIEDGTAFPTRVRWSHPGNPESWAELDYDDIPEGGSPIRAIQQFRNMLLVYFDHKVIGYVGTTPATLQKFTVSEKAGSPSPLTITEGHGSAYFLHPQTGVWEFTGEGLQELSAQLRPLFEDRIDGVDVADTDAMQLNWVNRQLWVSYPWEPDGTPTAGYPSVNIVGSSRGGNMSWVVYQTGTGDAFASVSPSTTSPQGVGVTAQHNQTVARLDSSLAQDSIEGAAPFGSELRTRWAFGDNPAQKKRWRRAELVMAPQDAGYSITVELFVDFLPDIAEKQFQVVVEDGGDADPPRWDSETWDQFSWAANPIGDAFTKTANLGSANAVQMLFRGTPNEPWGVQEVVYRIRPRKFR